MFLLMSLMVLKTIYSALKLFNFVPTVSITLSLSLFSILPIYDTTSNPASLWLVDSINFPILVMTLMLAIMLDSAKMLTLNSSLIFLFSMLTFSVSKIILFFMAFEINLIPIFLVILGWGYQPERLFASKIMIFYTASGSLPLLLAIIFLQPMSQFNSTFLLSSISMASLTSFMLLMAFLIKLPIFSMHLWLPIAHVEAPIMGSMILAGVLLKLGGYGLIRMTLNLNLSWLVTSLILFFSCMGGMTAMIYCLSQVDIKVIIAYSSVAHMSIATSAALSMSATGVAAAIITFVAHGFASSLMFFIANLMYMSSNSRHLLMNKGLISIMPQVMMLWFFVCLINAGGPPTMNLMAEILTTISLMVVSPFTLLAITMSLFVGMIFNMKLFSITSQGTTIEHHKMSNLSYSSYLLAWSHIALSAFLILSVYFMMV